MRVFIAGATGTIGRPVVWRLIEAGHEVIGLTRRATGAALLRSLGAQAVVGNALDATALERLVIEAAPTHVLHLLTAIPPHGPVRPRDLAETNELRIRGTANLLHASVVAGVQRIVAESFALAYGVGDLGSHPLPEPRLATSRHRDPEMQAIVDALRSLEEQLAAAAEQGSIETVVLRYGMIYGPGVPSTEGMMAGLQRRRLPLISGAEGLASFIHIDDAVNATLAALERGRSGAVYNIADDRPAGFGEFLLDMAEAAGAPRPRSVPRWLARLAAPMAAEIADARVPMSNERAKGELLWTPRYRSAHEGLTALAAAR